MFDLPKVCALSILQFGSFEVHQNGRPIASKAWPQRKTKSLLKVLVSKPGQVFTQDQLIDMLYPDLDPQKAIKSLYNRISELRRVLEPDLSRGNQSQFILRVGQGSYAFNKDASCWIDTEAFETELQAAHDSEQHDRFAEAIAHYRQALELHQDEYLAEDRYEEWTLDTREQWRERCTQALLDMAECHANLKQYQRAVDCCERVIFQQPDREYAYRQKMLYTYSKGDYRKAIQTYHQCKAALEEHLEVEPAPETQVLYEQLRDSEVAVVSLPKLEPPDLMPDRVEAEVLYQQNELPRLTRRVQNRALAMTLMTVVVLSLIGGWAFSFLTTAQKIPSIAVLPLVNLSSNNESEVWFTMDDFADGTTIELTNALTQIEGLRVASATSAFTFRERNASISQIGAALNVSTLLEGSVRRSGSKLRITLQLINVNDGLHLWSGKFESDIWADSFTMMDEIIPSIIESIMNTLKVYFQAPARGPFNDRLILDRP